MQSRVVVDALTDHFFNSFDLLLFKVQKLRAIGIIPQPGTVARPSIDAWLPGVNKVRGIA